MKEELEVHMYYPKELCEKYSLNIFHKTALYNADYSVDEQCSFIARELVKLGVDSLAISGFIKLMQKDFVKFEK